MDLSEILKQGVLGVLAVYFIVKDDANQKAMIKVLTEDKVKTTEALDRAAAAIEQSNQLHRMTSVQQTEKT